MAIASKGLVMKSVYELSADVVSSRIIARTLALID